MSVVLLKAKHGDGLHGLGAEIKEIAIRTKQTLMQPLAQWKWKLLAIDFKGELYFRLVVYNNIILPIVAQNYASSWTGVDYEVNTDITLEESFCETEGRGVSELIKLISRIKSRISDESDEEVCWYFFQSPGSKDCFYIDFGLVEFITGGNELTPEIKTRIVEMAETY